MQEREKFITIQELPSSALTKISDIGYQKTFPDKNSTANIWNMSDDGSDK